jgi:hypothetical protein
MEEILPIESASQTGIYLSEERLAILEKRYATSIKKWLFEKTTPCLIFLSVAK